MPRGRPLGSRDKKPRDPEICRANARGPRVRMDEDLKAVAYKKLGPALRGPGMDGIAAMIQQGPSIYFDRFKWACEFAADRLGLPRAQIAEVTGEVVLPIEIVFKHGGQVK